MQAYPGLVIAIGTSRFTSACTSRGCRCGGAGLARPLLVETVTTANAAVAHIFTRRSETIFGEQ